MAPPAPGLAGRIRAAFDSEIVTTAALGGGCIGDVRRITLADGRDIVAKISPQGGLAVEGAMLRYLAQHSTLPVPEVYLTDENLLLMSYIANDGNLNDDAQINAAHHLAALHEINWPKFGFECDTVIGGLPHQILYVVMLNWHC